MIVAAPGHTPGHVAAWFDEEHVLVAGDALASHQGRPMVGVFNADPVTAAATARQLATLDAHVACFGTGTRCATTRRSSSPRRCSSDA